MQSYEATCKTDQDLKRAIERQITQRTWSRVHRLLVEVVEGRIVVHGHTSSYYVKQLALEGVLDVLGSANSVCVELDIEVASFAPRATYGR